MTIVKCVFPRISKQAATTVISVIDVILMIVTLIVGAVMFDGAIVKGNGMAGPSAETLRYMGGKSEPDIRAGQVWRLVTPIVLHAGIVHLLSNLFFQLRFGYVLEARWGIVKYVGTYVVAGIGASLLSCIQSPNSISVGASGALFGVVGADVTYLAFNWSHHPDAGREACFLTIVIVLNFLFGISSNVDNWAHFGGFIIGLFLGACLPTPQVQRSNEKLIRVGAGIGCLGMFALWFGVLYGRSY